MQSISTELTVGYPINFSIIRLSIRLKTMSRSFFICFIIDNKVLVAFMKFIGRQTLYSQLLASNKNKWIVCFHFIKPYCFLLYIYRLFDLKVITIVYIFSLFVESSSWKILNEQLLLLINLTFAQKMSGWRDMEERVLLWGIEGSK